MSEMRIRRASEEDFDAMMKIYEDARQFMRENGNPNQWGRSWPSAKMVRRDIEDGSGYVCETDDGKIAAVFCYKYGHTDIYDSLEDGKWQKESDDYGMIFRIASAQGVHGAAGCCLDWAYGQCGDLRIDTRGENIPMISLLTKKGFVCCGKVPSSVRKAFQKV